MESGQQFHETARKFFFLFFKKIFIVESGQQFHECTRKFLFPSDTENGHSFSECIHSADVCYVFPFFFVDTENGQQFFRVHSFS